jgi:serine/threonine protein phosphatase PrpC
LADRPDAALFAVYDGHGGKEVAKFAAEHMVR